MSEQLPSSSKPLSRLNAYLLELEKSISLFKDVLIKAKEVLVVLTMILFFLLGVIKVLKGGL